MLAWAGRGARPVVDYRAAVHAAARQLGLGEGLADAIHELAGREGYQLRQPIPVPPDAPAPAVASKIGADLNDVTTWEKGPAANREARYRFARNLETASRFKL